MASRSALPTALKVCVIRLASSSVLFDGIGMKMGKEARVKGSPLSPLCLEELLSLFLRAGSSSEDETISSLPLLEAEDF